MASKRSSKQARKPAATKLGAKDKKLIRYVSDLQAIRLLRTMSLKEKGKEPQFLKYHAELEERILAFQEKDLERVKDRISRSRKSSSPFARYYAQHFAHQNPFFGFDHITRCLARNA